MDVLVYCPRFSTFKRFIGDKIPVEKLHNENYSVAIIPAYSIDLHG
jgi:hypothetical protein